VVDKCPLDSDCLAAVRSLPGLARQMDETHENTIRIIQGLHGTVGTQESGLIGDMKEIKLRVSNLESSGRCARAVWRDRMWQLLLGLLPMLGVLVWFALMGWHLQAVK